MKRFRRPAAARVGARRRHCATRRTDVIGVVPNPASPLRLAGGVLVEARDKWQSAPELMAA